MPEIVFLISPAHCGGKRARQLLNPAAEFPLAARLRDSGATIGEIFQFLSGLYFRGKLAYAETFHRAPPERPGALVITPGRGLVPPVRTVSRCDLLDIAAIGVSMDEPRYRDPFERDAAALASRLASDGLAGLLRRHAT